ncbi:MAG: hypothetical protein JWP01_3964 [Myxococcales bacterium]|nr:hypothetical protein [Myxococcales bacterium]
MASPRIPTLDQVFGALSGFWKVVEQEAALPPTEKRFAFGSRLGHESPGSFTSIRLGPQGREAYEALQSKLWAATHWGRRGRLDRLVTLCNRFVLEMAVDPGPGRAAIRHRCRQQLELQIGSTMRRWRVASHVPARLRFPHEIRLLGLTFRCMTDDQKKKLDSLLRHGLKRRKSTPGQPIEDFEHLQGADVVCIADVEAPDLETAFIVAQELIDDRLDCIAGIAALLREPGDRSNDPRRWAGPRIAIELGAARGQAHVGGTAPHEVDLTVIAEDRQHRDVKRLLRLVTNSSPREGELRLLRAIRWLGRSRRARTEIDAYLNASVAYETVLQGSNKLGIGFGLRLRCAQLLATNRRARRHLFENVGNYYEKRSMIVHANRHTLDLDELVGFWSLLNHIIRAYMQRGFSRKTEAEIERWFEDQSL